MLAIKNNVRRFARLLEMLDDTGVEIADRMVECLKHMYQSGVMFGMRNKKGRVAYALLSKLIDD